MTAELLAAMDMSRSHKDEYLAVMVGLKKNITATYQGLGYNRIHMSRIDKKTREKILARLNFDRKYCIAFCLIDREFIIDEIKARQNDRN